MDPFTQKILEKAEKRSKIHGLSNAPKIQSETDSALTTGYDTFDKQFTKSNINLAETNKSNYCTTSISGDGSYNTTTWTNVPSTSYNKRQSLDKDVDVGIEINIKSRPNVEVQVEVEQQTISETCSESTSIISSSYEPNIADVENSVESSIKSQTHNRLQRLNALYSGDEISSPIHRTENKFHADLEHEEGIDNTLKIPGKKLKKLHALADEIKNWEDDLSHPDYKQKPHRILNSSISENDGKQEISSTSTNKQTPSKGTKQLKWDKNVYDSLEAQGFQRRESTAKLYYDYGKTTEHTVQVHRENQVTKDDDKNNKNQKNNEKKNEKKIQKDPCNSPISTKGITPGLVSKNADMFEKKTVNSPCKQKDPAEMSLRERVMLFEKNKGKALLPKTGVQTPVTQRATVTKSKIETKTIDNKENYHCNDIKDYPAGEITVKDKVAALLSGSSTISEQQIKADITKQRQKEMSVVINRFNNKKEQEKEPRAMPPPPPPPVSISDSLPKIEEKHIDAKCAINYNKRRSPENPRKINNEGNTLSDDAKRAKIMSPSKNLIKKKTDNLYPVLSDLESIESDNGNCTTATMSTPSINDTNDDDNNDKSDIHSDDEDESSMDYDDDFNNPPRRVNVSLGRELKQIINLNSKDEKTRRDSSINSSSTSIDPNALCCEGIDDYLDEALDDDDSIDDDHQKIPNKNKNNGTTTSNSFCYQRKPLKHVHYKAISEESEESNNEMNSMHTSSFKNKDNNEKEQSKRKTPIKSELTVNNNDNVVTLVHTVSFYRSQQNANSANSTPSKHISRNYTYNTSNIDNEKYEMKNYKDDNSDTDDMEDPDESLIRARLVQEKIKRLLEEVCKQQQIISQTSQALNLCASTVEFSGSTEAVEGERHLLVATHRRQAALDEIQRLKVERTIRPRGSLTEKGRLSVEEITIPLKDEYIQKLVKDAVSGHNLVCLLKYGETVLATTSVPTLPGLKSVKFPDTLTFNCVYGDFKITLEVYGMTAQREILPHEVKYHINKKTPKKKGINDSILVMPRIQSPAGPQAVRTPALVQYGFAIFSIRETQRDFWTLTPSISLTPLKGIVQMKIKCELSVNIVYKGFLTMFEDISGFGAWHRRWCYLNNNALSYWKYPDDEKTQTPIGTIDLTTCISLNITTAPRDICARLNTLLLECKRPAIENEVPTLLTVPAGNVTIVRYLLSADSKEERDQWCRVFNKALTLIRAWNISSSSSSSSSSPSS